MISSGEIWQLYDNQGRPIVGKGATKTEVFSKGMLHGASHVWIYRISSSKEIEVLLQKRAGTKHTWPNCYDISAAGHIDLGEDPIDTAIRETKEELGYIPNEKMIRFVGVQRQHLTTPDNQIENEFCWLYLLELGTDTSFTLQVSEVDSVKWMSLEKIKQEVLSRSITDKYVPHGDTYFRTIFEAICIGPE